MTNYSKSPLDLSTRITEAISIWYFRKDDLFILRLDNPLEEVVQSVHNLMKSQ